MPLLPTCYTQQLSSKLPQLRRKSSLLGLSLCKRIRWRDVQRTTNEAMSIRSNTVSFKLGFSKFATPPTSSVAVGKATPKQACTAKAWISTKTFKSKIPRSQIGALNNFNTYLNTTPLDSSNWRTAVLTTSAKLVLSAFSNERQRASRTGTCSVLSCLTTTLS